MSVATLGSGTFLDAFTPAKGKSEWGMDTLTRKLTGARSLLESFIATLAQGQVYQGYYLQTWEPDDNPNVATVTLNYKGLITGGTPLPDAQSEIAPASGAISKSYASENSGLGRVYRKEPLYKYGYSIIPINQIVEDSIGGYRDIYATGVTIEFTYDAIQTTYRYINVGKPNAPRFFEVDIPRIPVIKKSRIITSDGAIYGRNAPGALTDDLIPEVLNRVVGFVARHVIGSPYYECQDVVRRELGEGDSDSQGTFGP